MEDRCVICGKDVSDLGVHICPKCLSPICKNTHNTYNDAFENQKINLIKKRFKKFLKNRIPKVK